MAEMDLSGLAGGGSSQRSTMPIDEVRTWLSQIAMPQFAGRMGGWFDALQSFVQRANASPEALSALTSPQLRQQAQALQQAQRMLARSMGPFAGAQLPAAQGQAIAQQPWLQTMLNPVMQGQQGLMKFVQGTSYPVPGGQTSTATTTQPTDPTEWMRMMQGLVNLGFGVAGAWPKGGATTTDISGGGAMGGGGYF